MVTMIDLIAVISFDNDFMLEVYEELFDNNEVFLSITALKMFAVCMVMFNWYHLFLKSTKGGENKKMPITPYDIFRGIFLVVAIGLYDNLLSGIDSIMVEIENLYKGFESKWRIAPFDVPEVIEEPEKSWNASLSEFANEALFLLENPFHFVANMLKGFLGFFDILIYGAFLAERYFFLGLLRVLGGIALACYAIPRLEKWFWQWFGLLVAIYLLIIPAYLANAFTNIIYDKAVQKVGVQVTLLDSTGVTGTDTTGVLILFIILALCVYIKWRLFKKANQIIFKIFT